MNKAYRTGLIALSILATLCVVLVIVRYVRSTSSTAVVARANGNVNVELFPVGAAVEERGESPLLDHSNGAQTLAISFSAPVLCGKGIAPCTGFRAVTPGRTVDPVAASRDFDDATKVTVSLPSSVAVTEVNSVFYWDGNITGLDGQAVQPFSVDTVVVHGPSVEAGSRLTAEVRASANGSPEQRGGALAAPAVDAGLDPGDVGRKPPRTPTAVSGRESRGDEPPGPPGGLPPDGDTSTAPNLTPTAVPAPGTPEPTAAAAATPTASAAGPPVPTTPAGTGEPIPAATPTDVPSTALPTLVPLPIAGGDGTGKAPPMAQTPEVGSLVLFGSGAAGLTAYALARLRTRRRS